MLLLVQMCSIACPLPHVKGDSVCIAAKEYQGASIVPTPDSRQELCSAMVVRPYIACAEALLPTRVIPAASDGSGGAQTLLRSAYFLLV